MGGLPGINYAGQPFRGPTGTGCPVVGDEPYGCDEVAKPGSRWTVPEDFMFYAAHGLEESGIC